MDGSMLKFKVGLSSLYVTVGIRTLSVFEEVKSCMVNIESMCNLIPLDQHLAHVKCKYTNVYIVAYCWYTCDMQWLLKF